MKLAEALILRSDPKRVYEQIKTRAQASARYQEGETPSEDAQALVGQAEEALNDLEDLIRRINVTNASATIDGGATLTAALAEPDVLRLRYALLTSVADSAVGRNQQARQIRTELKFISALSVQDLRSAADDVAKRHRELDAKIQEANWRVDLVEGLSDGVGRELGRASTRPAPRVNRCRLVTLRRSVGRFESVTARRTHCRDGARLPGTSHTASPRADWPTNEGGDGDS